jgi:hypothetical protein
VGSVAVRCFGLLEAVDVLTPERRKLALGTLDIFLVQKVELVRSWGEWGS